jgi:hypothetical protein
MQHNTALHDFIQYIVYHAAIYRTTHIIPLQKHYKPHHTASHHPKPFHTIQHPIPPHGASPHLALCTALTYALTMSAALSSTHPMKDSTLLSVTPSESMKAISLSVRVIEEARGKRKGEREGEREKERERVRKGRRDRGSD